MRVISPQGDIGDVPAERLSDAIAAGGKVLSDEEFIALINRSELERKFFEKKWGETHKPLRLPRGYGKW